MVELRRDVDESGTERWMPGWDLDQEEEVQSLEYGRKGKMRIMMGQMRRMEMEMVMVMGWMEPEHARVYMRRDEMNKDEMKLKLWD